MFSLLPFKAVESSHINGKIDSNDTKISVACIKNPRDMLLKFLILYLSFYN